MYTFEKKYIDKFQEREKKYLQEVEETWLKIKNSLHEECEKYYSNGYLGFEIFSNFFLSTEEATKKLKDWHRQIHDMKLPGGAVLALLHSSLVILFNDGLKEIKEKNGIQLQNIPYYKKEIQFVTGIHSTFLENYNTKIHNAHELALSSIKNFLSKENLTDYVYDFLTNGNTGVEIYFNFLLYKTQLNLENIVVPEYLQILVVQDKIVISLAEIYIEKIKKLKLILDVYGSEQTSTQKFKNDVVKKEDFDLQKLITYYSEGYQNRLKRIVKDLKQKHFVSVEYSNILGECLDKGQIGFPVYNDIYVLSPYIKDVLAELILLLPRYLILTASSTGELILRYNIKDQVLKDNKCYGSYRNQLLFYTKTSEE